MSFNPYSKEHTMDVAICGPNLRDQSKGQFHVHAAGCGDLKHYGRKGKYGGEDGWMISVASKLELSAEINCDILSDYGLEVEDAEGREMLLSWLSDIHFAPCCSSLPVEVAA